MGSLLSELAEQGFVLPDSGNSNVEVMRQLSIGTSGKLIGSNQKKIFLLIDGLGYNNMQAIISRSKVLSEAAKKFECAKLTTTFPSTTMNVLSTLYSGLTTAEHGIVGTNLFIKEAGAMVNCIYLSSATDPMGPKLSKLEPAKFYPKGKIIDDLKAKGKKVAVLEDAKIMNSGFSTATFNKEDLTSFITFEDMLVKARRIIKAGTADYIFLYYDLLDSAEHMYNPQSEEVEQIISNMLLSLDRLMVPFAKDNGYDLIVTSDHGHVKVTYPDDNTFDSTHPINEFLDGPTWGEPRAMFAQVKDGKDGAFEDYFSKAFKDVGALVSSEEAIKAGLFGSKSVSDALRYRFGTHIVIPKENKCIYYLFPGMKPKPFESKGRHGGLNTEEMYVPLLLY